MKINPIVYGSLVLAVFFGVILGFQSAGIWSTSGKVDAAGKQIQPSSMDVNTIKGWMTLEQIVTTYNVPLADILTEFDLPADTPIDTPVKDLESETFETDGLREFLQGKIDGQSTPLEENPPADDAAAAPPAETPPAPAVAPEPAVQIEPTEHATVEGTVTGSTTFQNLYDWGVSREVIQSMFGELPPAEMKVKDFTVSKGLSFGDFKTQLQTEIDKNK